MVSNVSCLVCARALAKLTSNWQNTEYKMHNQIHRRKRRKKQQPNMMFASSNFVVRFHLHLLLRAFRCDSSTWRACLWQVNWQFRIFAVTLLCCYCSPFAIEQFTLNISLPYKYQWAAFHYCFCRVACIRLPHFNGRNFDFSWITIDWCRHLTCSLTDHSFFF